MAISEESIKNALSSIMEPDLKQDLIALNLVTDISFDAEHVKFTVSVQNPAMHAKKRMIEACEFAIQRSFGNNIIVECNVIPLPKEAKKTTLTNVKNIVAVASGKGGVGKSTVTANLAISLAKQGFTVGIVDADIYGPSMPTMFDCVHARPQTIEVEDKQYIKPIESHGIKILSIGFFSELNQAVVWRGPMASKALKQMFYDSYWGELDYLLLDLPPGTGDIQLTLVQNVPITGVVIVTTPQMVALADARKGVEMFRTKNINVPVLGIVENMAWFTPEELPDSKYYIFGRDGGKNLAASVELDLIGQIPLIQSVREAGDVGRPAALQENSINAQMFDELGRNVVEKVNWRNKNLEATKLVEVS